MGFQSQNQRHRILGWNVLWAFPPRIGCPGHSILGRNVLRTFYPKDLESYHTVSEVVDKYQVIDVMPSLRQIVN